MTHPGSTRFPLSILMAFIGFLAVGLGAMRLGSWLAVRLSLVVTLVALLVGLLGAIVRRGEGAWVGFALFGWTTWGLAYMPPLGGIADLRIDPTAELVAWLSDEFHPMSGVWPDLPSGLQSNGRFMQYAQALNRKDLAASSMVRSWLSPAEAEKFDDWAERWLSDERSLSRSEEARTYARPIGHALFALLFALFGAILGRTLERSRWPGQTLGSSGG